MKEFFYLFQKFQLHSIHKCWLGDSLPREKMKFKPCSFNFLFFIMLWLEHAVLEVAIKSFTDLGALKESFTPAVRCE